MGGVQRTGIVFRLAEGMAGVSRRIVFLFTGDSRSHAADPELMGTLRFAESIYVLGDDYGSTEVPDSLAEGVEALDYDGWVGLLEDCDRIVSWT